MKNSIESIANTVIEHYGTSDPFELAKRMSIFVYSAELPKETNGFYFQFNGKEMICLNSETNYTEQRFVCAHELGHVVLHNGLNIFQLEHTTLYLSGKYEKEADLFASYLLIDKNFEMYDGMTASNLCALTGVPEETLKRRYNVT